MRCKIPSKDLGLKLNETVCRYEGEPKWVRVSEGRIFLYSLTEPGGHYMHIKSDDPKFDVASPPLGYMQHKNEVWYLTRIPLRKTKQGVCQAAIACRQLGHKIDYSAKTLGSPIQKLLFSQGFIDMVKGNYPPLGDSLKKLRGLHAKDSEKVYQVCVRRDVAMEINQVGVINVSYKGKFCGWIQPDKNMVHIPHSDLGWVISKYLSHELDWEVD